MVKSCVAYNCKERFNKLSSIKFHRFPTNPHMQQRWVLAIGRENFVPKSHTYLCNKHFKEEDYYITSTGSRRIKEDAVPSVFDSSSCRSKRKTKRRILKRRYSSSQSSDGSTSAESQSADTFQNPSSEELESVQDATRDGTLSAESLLAEILQNPSVKLVSVEDDSTEGHPLAEPQSETMLQDSTLVELESIEDGSRDGAVSPESQSEVFRQNPSFGELESVEDGFSDGYTSAWSHSTVTPQNPSFRFGQDAQGQSSNLLSTAVQRNRRQPVFFGDFLEEDLNLPDRRHRYWTVTQEMVKNYRARIRQLLRTNRNLKKKIVELNGLVD